MSMLLYPKGHLGDWQQRPRPGALGWLVAVAHGIAAASSEQREAPRMCKDRAQC
jgi:hypothetical protein